jgi:hypothetical protein
MMHTLLLLTGLGQIALALASLFLPRVLGWRAQVARLAPLTGRVFWVYAAYILGTNLALGLLTVLAPQLLLDRSPLARFVAGYAGLYWGARLLIQLVWFRGVCPQGGWYAAADLAVTLAFALWTFSYGAVAFDLW